MILNDSFNDTLLTGGSNTDPNLSGNDWHSDGIFVAHHPVFSATGALRLSSATSNGWITTVNALDLSGNDGFYSVSFLVKGWLVSKASQLYVCVNSDCTLVTFSAIMTDYFESKVLNFTHGRSGMMISFKAVNRLFLTAIVVYTTSAPAYTSTSNVGAPTTTTTATTTTTTTTTTTITTAAAAAATTTTIVTTTTTTAAAAAAAAATTVVTITTIQIIYSAVFFNVGLLLFVIVYIVYKRKQKRSQVIPFQCSDLPSTEVDWVFRYSDLPSTEVDRFSRGVSSDMGCGGIGNQNVVHKNQIVKNTSLFSLPPVPPVIAITVFSKAALMAHDKEWERRDLDKYLKSWHDSIIIADKDEQTVYDLHGENYSLLYNMSEFGISLNYTHAHIYDSVDVSEASFMPFTLTTLI